MLQCRHVRIRRTRSPRFSALVVTVYFWWSNIKGIHESSAKALRIMQITTVMVVMFLIWCTLTLLTRGPAQIPPAPTASNLEFATETLWDGFEGHVWITDSRCRDHRRVRTFAAGDERL